MIKTMIENEYNENLVYNISNSKWKMFNEKIFWKIILKSKNDKKKEKLMGNGSQKFIF